MHSPHLLKPKMSKIHSLPPPREKICSHLHNVFVPQGAEHGGLPLQPLQLIGQQRHGRLVV